MDYDALERLARLKESGALTEEEFAKQKGLLLEQTEVVFAALHGSRPKVGGMKKIISRLSLLQNISAASFVIGLCAVTYSTFIYDPTISPLEGAGSLYLSETPTNLEEQILAIEDVSRRLKEEMAGVRTINIPRMEEQRRIFSLGALLMVLGTIGFLAPKRKT